MSLLRRLARSPLVRVVVTLGLLAVVALRIDWSQALDRVRHGSPGWFALGVALVLAAQVLGAFRWLLLLRPVGVEARWTPVLRAYFIGQFASSFLPTTFGGDAVRAVLVGHDRAAVGRALTSVLVDRASSVACFFAVGWILLATDVASVPGRLVWILVWTTLGLALATLALAAVLAGGARLGRRLPARVLGPARSARDQLLAYARDLRLSGVVLLLGCVYQLLIDVEVWALARAIGLELPLSLIAVVAPVVLVITVLPVSVAGFGLRESGYIALLGTAGVSATDATVLSLLTVAAVAVASLPGAAAMLLPGRAAALPPTAEAR